MGLIKAAMGAAGGTLADQWKEFFYCDSISNDVLMVKGQKRTSSRSSNTKGNDNIISNGSGIAVADGQCMIIVEQGKVVEICAEPGEFTYDNSIQPTIFTGDLGESIKESFSVMGKRFTFGGDTGADQRVYYFNTKELLDNKFGTPNPIPFRVYDPKVDLDLDTSIRCSGVYSYRITDPIRFYTNIAGNVSDEYRREDLSSQLKAEFIDALQPAFAVLSDLGIRPNQIPGHKDELKKAVDDALNASWTDKRGLTISAIAISTINIPDEDAEAIKQAQRARTFSNAAMGAGLGAIAGADAMKAAASNESGAMAGFMGMGMAMNANQMNNQATSNLYAMGQQQQMPQGNQGMAAPQGMAQPQGMAPQQGMAQQGMAPQGDAWQCSCGNMVVGNFCSNCGSQKPVSATWRCQCGTENTGNFCSNCGSPRQ